LFVGAIAHAATLSRPPHPASDVRDDRDTPLCWRRDGREHRGDLPDEASAEGCDKVTRRAIPAWQAAGSCITPCSLQSSLRGAKRRSNPDYLRNDRLDCFASLAMTVVETVGLRDTGSLAVAGDDDRWVSLSRCPLSACARMAERRIVLLWGIRTSALPTPSWLRDDSNPASMCRTYLCLPGRADSP
jgi:hypothetical protein